MRKAIGKVFQEKPTPEDAVFVNDLSLASPLHYGTRAAYEAALTGKRKAEGGVLPDDNVRIYVPMDLNADFLLWRLHSLYESLGFPDEGNESAYQEAVGQLISLLQVYDAAQAEKEQARGHSRKGKRLASEMIRCMEEHEGTAEHFPYEEMGMLGAEYGYNAETEAAMEEARAISEGSISAKRYHSVEEFLADEEI